MTMGVPMRAPMRAIDAWVNAYVPGAGWQKQVAAQLFKRPAEEIFRKSSADELVALMDPFGVEKAIVGLSAELPEKDIVTFAAARPDRFAFAANLDPRRGMKAVRALEALHKNHP